MPLKFKELEKILRDFSYILDHQKGSHQTYSFGEYMLTVPKHKEIKSGTAKTILEDIARHHMIDSKTIKERYNIKL